MGPPAVPQLMKALNHEESSVRLQAARILGEIGPWARPQRSTIFLLGEQELDPVVRRQIHLTLQNIGGFWVFNKSSTFAQSSGHSCVAEEGLEPVVQTNEGALAIISEQCILEAFPFGGVGVGSVIKAVRRIFFGR